MDLTNQRISTKTPKNMLEFLKGKLFFALSFTARFSHFNERPFKHHLQYETSLVWIYSGKQNPMNHVTLG